MNNKEMVNYFLFAWKNLKKRGLRSWLTLLGIFIGITAVVSLITLGTGLQLAVSSQFGISSTELISVQAGGISGYGPPGSNVANPLTKQDGEAIAKLSSIEYVIPRNIEPVTMEYNDYSNVVVGASIIKGLEDETYSILDEKVEQGKLLEDGNDKKVLLGYNYLDKEKNGFDKTITPGKKVKILGKEFEVVGILKKQGSIVFDNVVLVYDNALKDLVGYGDDVSLLAVKVKDKDLMGKAKEDIEKLMRKRRGVKIGEEDFSVETPQALMNNVNSILGGIKAFIIVIASISILVGALGIVNTMTTSVFERRKEIGIMKAIGAKNKHIFWQFFIESGMLGLIGGIIGVLAGLAIGLGGTVGINNFIGAEVAPTINYMLIGFTLLGSFLIGGISGIVPALQAARQNPAEALRS